MRGGVCCYILANYYIFTSYLSLLRAIQLRTINIEGGKKGRTNATEYKAVA